MEPFGISENGKYIREDGMNTKIMTFYPYRNPQSLIFNFPRQWKEPQCPPNVYF
jgi:hypothetical protein